MATNEVMIDIVKKSIIEIVKQWGSISMRILLPFLISIIIIAVIGIIIRKVFNFYFRVSGYSKREAKKRTNIIMDLIDLLQSMFN